MQTNKVQENSLQMKRIFLSIIIAFAAIASFADNAADARKVLDNLSARIVKGGGATAQFSMSGSAGSLSGRVSIKNSKFFLSTSAMTAWYNGKTQWVYVKQSEEVNVSNPSSASQQTMNPYAFLSLYKNGYTLSMKKEGQGRTVRMVSQKNAMKEVVITLGKGDVPSLVKFSQGGKWTTIRLSSFQIKKIPESTFVFNPKNYPNAEIIDLR